MYDPMFNQPIPSFLHEYLGKPDDRVRGWPGLGSPTLITLLYLTYALVLSLGRRWMKSRDPFRLRRTLVFYNLLQITLSAYILREVAACIATGTGNVGCDPFPKVDVVSARLARAVWLFYLTKMLDLMDTVFFVLRKKDDQITFLHVYHHVAMLMAWYLGALYTPGGQAWLSVGINAGVHVLMYLYYLLSALGPSYRKFLWWKRYLTQLQLVQFVVVGLQVGYILYQDCAKPTWLAHVALFYNATLISLFLGFYKNAYVDRASKKHEENRTTERILCSEKEEKKIR